MTPSGATMERDCRDDSPQLPLLSSSPLPSEAPLPVDRLVHKLNRRVALLCTVGMLLHANSRNCLALVANDICNGLSFSNTQYGTGLSLFFCGFVGIMTFSGWLVSRLGAPTWFSLSMVAWGALSLCLGLMQTATHYYLLMFAFGLSQGSYYSGATYYYTLFYPEVSLAGPYAAIQAALAFSMPLASWVSIGVLSLDELFSVSGWRLLLVAQALLPIVFSPFVYFLLPASIQKASFLDVQEKQCLREILAKQSQGTTSLSLYESSKRILCMKVFWIGSAVTFLYDSQEKLIFSWVPLIIRAAFSGTDTESETCGVTGGDTLTSIALTSIPFAFAGIVCILVFCFHRSIRHPILFASTLQVLSGCCLFSWVGLSQVSFLAGFIPLTISISISLCTIAVFTRVFVANFSPDIVGTALAEFNTIGNSGCLIFPVLLGILVDAHGHGSFVTIVGAITLTSGLLMRLVTSQSTNPRLSS